MSNDTEEKLNKGGVFVDKILRGLSLVSIASYIMGFLIWNTFLLRLKFQEIEILQSRFIYTGFFFILFLIVSYFVAKYFFLLLRYFFPLDIRWDWRRLDNETIQKYATKSTLGILMLLFIYSIVLFPSMPRMVGGARPFAISIVPDGSNLTLKNLEDLSMPKADGSEIQTGHVCVAYENSSMLLILTHDRVLRINKAYLKGLAPLPGHQGVESFEREVCTKLARLWILPNLLR